MAFCAVCSGVAGMLGVAYFGSAQQGDRRVIFAITGLDSAAARSRESEAIVNWAFRQFAEKTVVKAGRTLASASVFLGAEDSVPLVTEKDVTMLVPVSGPGQLEAEAVYTGPLEAPIAKGQQLGELIIRPAGLPEARVPLVAAQAVDRGGIIKRVTAVAQTLMARFGGGSAPEAM